MNEPRENRSRSRTVSPSPSYSSQYPPDSRPTSSSTPAKIDTASNLQEKVPMLSPLDPSNASIRFVKQRSGNDLKGYFVGPRDIDRHSKLPKFFRLHGSILPKMAVPLFFVTLWATIITCLSKMMYNLSVSNVLLVILGFLVGMALTFRSSTAYERYNDGRKFWSQLLLNADILARNIWIHTEKKEGEEEKEALLHRISGLNLILAFAVALKHKLRFEPYTCYDDLRGLVGHLNTFAKDAEVPDAMVELPPQSKWQKMGSYWGLSFLESNPRKVLKESKKPLGNLPLEIQVHLAAYMDKLMSEDTLVMRYHSSTLTALNGLIEVMAGTDRILNTPLPIAYSIAISQITWVYVMLLPFQLFRLLDWVTIPGTAFAAYIILGISLIGSEIENPFGNDVNDLPLDTYCAQIAADLEVIAASRPPETKDFIKNPDNMLLFPLSRSGYEVWASRDEERIRDALRTKAKASLSERRRNSFSGSVRSDRTLVPNREGFV